MREDFAADPGFGLRFADEVASSRRIHGLFTAQVIDSGVDDPVPWLATAYVPGSSLEQAVRHHGPLEEVFPAETSDWFLARSGDAFVLPEDSDAFVGAGYVLGPADCERGIGAEPVAELFFDDLADERPFCVRSPDGEELVIVRLVRPGTEEDNGSVTVALSRYTRGG
ncbi:hypothetical protein ABZ362_12265 [Streptomyces sp. NPDC005951]|uniref:hypothetical protein n=1 Tax=Streptomyces sp. NPDC005951 TaxID=3154573 RepID=UPI003407878A